jgi:thiol-disulfide isomerase/thioredoxin
MQINHIKKGNNKLKYLAMSLIGGGLLIFGLIGLILLPKNGPNSSPSNKAVSIPPAQMNFPAPELNLRDVAGKPVSLADLQGNVVLVNNWATWCPPCREEMPILNSYFRNHRHQDFVLVAINAGETVPMVTDFVERYELEFPVWIDPGSSALNSFRNNYLPSSYLINQDGQVIFAWRGAVTMASLDEYITPLLKE